MAGLSTVAKNRIAEALASTYLAQHSFTVKYDDENNPIVTVIYTGSPECQFVISSIDNGAFTTSECPGIHLDAAETFRRSDFDLCIGAIGEWVERIADRQRDWILDEFGGVADRNPSLKQ